MQREPERYEHQSPASTKRFPVCGLLISRTFAQWACAENYALGCNDTTDDRAL